jgi:hypothetical protein
LRSPPSPLSSLSSPSLPSLALVISIAVHNAGLVFVFVFVLVLVLCLAFFRRACLGLASRLSPGRNYEDPGVAVRRSVLRGELVSNQPARRVQLLLSPFDCGLPGPAATQGPPNARRAGHTCAGKAVGHTCAGKAGAARLKHQAPPTPLARGSP